MSQHQMMSIAERDETFKTNAALTLHCLGQGTIDHDEANRIIEWQRSAAERRARLGQTGRRRNRRQGGDYTAGGHNGRGVR